MKEGFQGQRSYSLPVPLMQQVLQHPLCQGLYITDIGFYPYARFHRRKRRVGSAQYILLYCVHGEGWYQIGCGTRRALKANQWVILPAEVAHKYGSHDVTPWTIYWLHFAGQQAAALYAYLSKGAEDEPLTVLFTEERIRLFEALFSQLTLLPTSDGIVQASLSLPHFLATLSLSEVSPVLQPSTTNVVAASIDYMREHLERTVTVQELAQQARLSPSHFSALFRTQTGRPPIVYFNSLKVQRACQQLINTALPIKEIARQLGAEDAYYFSRLFTKVMGVSPRQFRKLNAT
ncbi:AraC family transcriptional regulator [Hymenobacter sp. YC55]|uniref:AraC family transcriptional regulator n=1 Tax=Hymenobacter sp. YC55 TaxID=3034019 RepID=UPI0023F6BDB3|nr:AraC family transcriptional regulator [Hymenobacter sp. YC55]MDF7814963.1 AraC family transcriptional regulator [Hymenobacter sp. YC55]